MGIYLVNSDSAPAIIKLLDGDGDVEVTFGMTSVSFSTDGGSVVSRVCEGRFPRLRDAITPNSADPVASCSVNIDRLITATKRVLIMSDNLESRAIDVNLSGKQLHLQCEAAELGGSESTVEVDQEYELHASIRINGNFIVQTMSVLSDVAEVAKSKISSAMVYYSVESDDLTAQYGIMGMARES